MLSDADADCIHDLPGQPLNATSPCLSHLITTANQHYWREQQYISELNHLCNCLTISTCVSLEGRISDRWDAGCFFKWNVHSYVCVSREHTHDYIYMYMYALLLMIESVLGAAGMQTQIHAFKQNLQFLKCSVSREICLRARVLPGLQQH